MIIALCLKIWLLQVNEVIGEGGFARCFSAGWETGPPAERDSVLKVGPIFWDNSHFSTNDRFKCLQMTGNGTVWTRCTPGKRNLYGHGHTHLICSGSRACLILWKKRRYSGRLALWLPLDASPTGTQWVALFNYTQETRMRILHFQLHNFFQRWEYLGDSNSTHGHPARLGQLDQELGQVCLDFHVTNCNNTLQCLRMVIFPLRCIIEPIAIYLTAELLGLIELIHAMRIVHADIKPDNFLLCHTPSSSRYLLGNPDIWIV